MVCSLDWWEDGGRLVAPVENEGGIVIMLLVCCVD